MWSPAQCMRIGFISPEVVFLLKQVWFKLNDNGKGFRMKTCKHGINSDYCAYCKGTEHELDNTGDSYDTVKEMELQNARFRCGQRFGGSLKGEVG